MNQNTKNNHPETEFVPKSKVMLAWSNGRETHLHPSMMFLVEGDHLHRLNFLNQMKNKLQLGPECFCRVMCNEYERYSDELWNLGLHVEAYKLLLCSATILFDVHRSWINHRRTSWYHPNMMQFRRLFHRCRQRAAQDSRLLPLFNDSEVKQTYQRLLDEYADCNISERIKVKDPGLWDDIYQWDGDDPLCD